MGVRRAEMGTGQAWRDIPPTNAEQLPHQREPLCAGRRAACIPIKHRGLERRKIEWIGDLVAILLIGPFVFLLPPVADGLGEIAREIAEEREGHLRAPLFAHE